MHGFVRCLVAVSFLAVAPSLSFAVNGPQEIFLSNSDVPTSVSGMTAGGSAAVYTIRSLQGQQMKFSVQASNDDCGFEISKSDQLGLLTDIKIFPATFEDQAAEGVVYKMSLYQSRTAFMENITCTFSMQVTD